jgi:hypothetical protein
MTEHFPKSTETATAWCRPCNRMTEHRIDGGRVGPCLDPKHPLRPSTQGKPKREAPARLPARAEQKDLFNK